MRITIPEKVLVNHQLLRLRYGSREMPLLPYLVVHSRAIARIKNRLKHKLYQRKTKPEASHQQLRLIRILGRCK